MLKIAAITIFALVSGSSLGQMMGMPMSTAPYFPLTDGARYDYVFVSGPRMTATAVMHAGQTGPARPSSPASTRHSVCQPAFLAPPMPPNFTGWTRMECITLAVTGKRHEHPLP